MERKLPEKNFLVGYRFSSFLEILKNAVPLATGSCGSSNRTFWLNEKRPNCDQFSWKEERPWELD